MNLDMLGWVLLVISAGLLIAGLIYKPTRFAFALVMFIGGIALNTTAFMGFIGVPMMLIAGVLLYTEYMQRRRPQMPLVPAGPAMPSPPVSSARYEPRLRPPPNDEPGPADD